MSAINGWEENAKLILESLKELKESQEKLRQDIGNLKDEISEIKNIQYAVGELKEWKKEIDEVISPSQLKELKDEVYEQKNKWIAAIAVQKNRWVITVVTFSVIQIILAILAILY